METQEIVARIRAVVGPGVAELHAPALMPQDVAAVAGVMESDPVGYHEINRFEREVAGICRRRFAVAVSSGTAALQLALLALGVRDGDFVMVPALTFAGAAAAVVHCGATPYFVDADPTRLGMSASELREALSRGIRPAAIMSVDLLGWAGDPEIYAVAAEWDIPVIEDAAEALGSSMDGFPCGSFGAVSVLSFNHNKIVTTGGGGAVLTDDPGLAEWVTRKATTCRVYDALGYYRHDDVGFNYRLPEICAAMGRSQLPRLAETIRRKAALFDAYDRALAPVREDVAIMAPLVDQYWNCWLSPVRLRGVADVTVLLQALREDGIMARPMFTPLPQMSPYAKCPAGPIDTARELAESIICLPSGAGLLGRKK